MRKSWTKKFIIIQYQSNLTSSLCVCVCSGLLNRYAKCKDSTEVVAVQNEYLASLEEDERRKEKDGKDSMYPPTDDEDDDDHDHSDGSCSHDTDDDEDDLLFRNTNRQTAFTAFDDETDEDDDDDEDEDEDESEDEADSDSDDGDDKTKDTKVIIDKLGNTHIIH